MNFFWSSYDKKDKSNLQDFLRSTSGSFFHEPSFFEYHPSERFNFLHFICRKKNKIVAWLPGHQNDNSFNSPAGASYGGPLFSESINLADRISILNTFIRNFSSKFVSINFITPPLIYYGDTGFLLSAIGFKYTDRLCCHALHLAGNKWPEVMSKSKRYDYRKANDKGLLFEELKSEKYSIFFKLLEDQNHKHNSNTTHTLQEILKLKLLLPERIKIFATSSNNEIQAAILVISINKKIAYAFYIVNGNRSEKINAVTHVIVNTAELLQKKNFEWFDLGPSSFNNFVLNDGIADFKKSLGGILFTRDSWTYSIK